MLGCRKVSVLPFIAALALGPAACADQPVALDPAVEQLLPPDAPGTEEVVLDRIAPASVRLHALFSGADREYLGHGVAHYTFELPLGPNSYDVVRLHRLVQERRPNRPMRTRGAVLMVHGSGQDFVDIFLEAGAPAPGPSTSAPLYLATKGVDVWGIDLAWTLVPEQPLADLGFMADWRMERDVDHTLAAMSAARFIRVLTGQGVDRMHLLGFSYGAAVAYGAAGRETQQDPWLRDIKALVPVDMPFKLESQAARDGACDRLEGLLENPPPVATTSTFQRSLSEAAMEDPDGIRTAPVPPFLQGLTNYQVILLIALNPPTWQFLGMEMAHDPELDREVPVRPLHTDADRWIHLLGGLAPHMPTAVNLDIHASHCDQDGTSVDDHLSEIEIPIRYLGAAAGFGEAGHYTLTRTASHDIQTHTVRVAAERGRDFGHADLFMAREAPELVWDVLADWITEGDADRRRRNVPRRGGHD